MADTRKKQEKHYKILWSSKKRPHRIRRLFVHGATDPDDAAGALVYMYGSAVHKIRSIRIAKEDGGKSYS